MTWFKVDDKFHASKEVKSIPRADRLAAVGLWTLAGAWCSDHLNDGFVPGYMIDDFAGSPELAQALVSATLWTKRRDGYQFRNWAKWQQTREDVEAKRAEARNRVAAHRARKKGENTGESNADETRYIDGVTTPPSRPVPTRPKTDEDQSSGELTSEQPGTGSTVHNPVESVDGELARIVEHVRKLTGQEIHPLTAAEIRTH